MDQARLSQQQYYEQDQAYRNTEANEDARRQAENEQIQQANEQRQQMVEEWQSQEAINCQQH